jgi:hypothetical protein
MSLLCATARSLRPPRNLLVRVRDCNKRRLMLGEVAKRVKSVDTTSEESDREVTPPVKNGKAKTVRKTAPRAKVATPPSEEESENESAPPVKKRKAKRGKAGESSEEKSEAESEPPVKKRKVKRPKAKETSSEESEVEAARPLKKSKACGCFSFGRLWLEHLSAAKLAKRSKPVSSEEEEEPAPPPKRGKGKKSASTQFRKGVWSTGRSRQKGPRAVVGRV